MIIPQDVSFDFLLFWRDVGWWVVFMEISPSLFHCPPTPPPPILTSPQHVPEFFRKIWPFYLYMTWTNRVRTVAPSWSETFLLVSIQHRKPWGASEFWDRADSQIVGTQEFYRSRVGQITARDHTEAFRRITTALRDYVNEYVTFAMSKYRRIREFLCRNKAKWYKNKKIK
jgi:hypothetical protein